MKRIKHAIAIADRCSKKVRYLFGIFLAFRGQEIYVVDMLTMTIEPMGPKVRRQRLRLGLTQGELAARVKISKPYLSLIETGRLDNPPSDEKLQKLEQALGMACDELVHQAHIQRTPHDVRAILLELSNRKPNAPAGPAPAAVAVLPGNSVEFKSVVTLLSEPVGWPDITDTHVYAARVCDDSMAPAYRPGEIVIFSPAKTVRGGDDCFVRLADGRTTFHRVFFETGDGDQPVVRLQPRNQKHRPAVVPADRVKAMHKAVFKYQPIARD